MGSRRQGRILALQALFSWDFTRQHVEELVRFQWIDDEKKIKIGEDVTFFAALLIKGTIENIEEIDNAIKRQIEHWDFKRLAKVDLAILRISVYALFYRNEIPKSVTIDEAVDIAKNYCSDDSYKFINGVLDGIQKKMKR